MRLDTSGDERLDPDDEPPWYGVRHGTDAVVSFFQAYGSTMEVEEFTPITIAGNDDAVLAVVRCRATSRSTGKQIDRYLHHYFKFRGGKVYYYRGTEDTARTEAALSGCSDAADRKGG